MVIPGLLRRAGHTLARQTFRNLANQASSSSDMNDETHSIECYGLDGELVAAVDAVTNDLHKYDDSAQQITKCELLSKLALHEKSPLYTSTIGLLGDAEFERFLATHSKDNNEKSRKFLELRDRRRLTLLRKEMFFRALKLGYRIPEAKRLAENSVLYAQNVIENSMLLNQSLKVRRSGDEREHILYDYALQSTRKILNRDKDVGEKLRSEWASAVPYPTSSASSSRRKNIVKIKIIEALELNRDWRVQYWTEWDIEAAKIMYEVLGSMVTEELLDEWHDREMDLIKICLNECPSGTAKAADSGDLKFLEDHLSTLDFPQTESITWFMHLVCVGLVNNPYLTRAKKLYHLEWFANYFNEHVLEAEEMHRRQSC